MEIESIIIKRIFVEHELRLMAEAGYPATVLDVWDETGKSALPVNLLPVRAEGRSVRLARMSAAMLIAAILLCVLALNVSWSAREDAISHLDGQIGEWKARANRVTSGLEAANALSDAVLSVRKRRLLDASPVEYWNELARLVPDDGWATSLTIEPGKISFTGASGSAADLIGRIEESRFFSNVSFSSPVTRDPGMAVDRFTIEMKPEGSVLSEAASE